MKLIKKLSVATICLMLAMPLQAATLSCLSENNTTLVPLRIISEELKAVVNYDKATGNITVKHGEREVVLKAGSKKAKLNGEEISLSVAAKQKDGTTYVPLRFIGEALGGEVNYQKGEVSVKLDDNEKSWKVHVMNNTTSSGPAFSNGTQTVAGKKVTYLKVNLNDSNVKIKLNTAYDKMNRAAELKTLNNGAKASVNGSYFAAYNGDIPLPDGTLIKDGRILHITDIGSTIGFTKNNKVLIDFVRTRVQGYINGEEAWLSYRVNRHTPDTSATVLYTSEHAGNITLPSGWSAVVCQNGKVTKIVTQAQSVPANGFILTMTSGRSEKFKLGDSVSYKTVFSPTYTDASEWEEVTQAVSAGPSLLISSKATGDAKNEGFTESKILTQVAQRTFIGVNSKNELVIGTVSASVQELKSIVEQMGLTDAMCLDGGASSGLYYNGSYLTTPGRAINNCISFYY